MAQAGIAHPHSCSQASKASTRHFRTLTFTRRRWPAALRRQRAQVSATGRPHEDFQEVLLRTQQSIIKEAEGLESQGHTFLIDKWSSLPTRQGITAVLQDGTLIEKGAVNTSFIQGKLTPERALAMSSRGRGIDPKGGQEYSAAALSLVFHPANPFVPTLRADVRLFKVGVQSWFGGGCDLTPAYLFEEDACQFHSFWKSTCNAHHADLYPKYKAWCDEYFYIPARQEHRGIGGIFFDDLEADDADFDAAQFVQDVAEGILPSWKEIAIRRGSMSFTEEQRQWQLLRRGRYLEFNLLYDRGVKFGLSGGRLESIMVSAPPLIAWRYNVVANQNSPEAKLVSILQKPREWT